VAQGDLDNLMGELHVKDLLIQCWQGQAFDPRVVLHEPLYVSEYMPALQVLEAFKRSGSPAAVVIDEYGSAQGMITLTDILEAIVGDIAAPDQPSEPQAVQREDGSWLVDGMLPIDEFKLLFDIEELPGETQELYQTVAGFVMMQLEHVPAITERFRWDGLDFEVLDMDGLRVDKVLVRPVAPETVAVPAEEE
jgi:putative hemolysin